MRKLQPGRGDSKLGCILWLLALAFGAYVAYQAIPAKMKAAELEKFMSGQAERSAEAPTEKIAANVLARVKDLGLPVDKKAIEVRRVGGRIRISYSYSVPINLFVTTYDWPFEVKVDRPVFIL